MKSVWIGAGALMLGFAIAPALHAQTLYTYNQLPPDSRARFDTWFSYFDPNQDGTITRDEYMQVQDQRFRAADTDGDGRLSKDEMYAAAQREQAAAAASGSSSGYSSSTGSASSSASGTAQ